MKSLWVGKTVMSGRSTERRSYSKMFRVPCTNTAWMTQHRLFKNQKYLKNVRMLRPI